MTTITPEEISTLRDLADDSGDMEWRRWANALADKIEAMQAENAALKQRIEESAREFGWDEYAPGRFSLHIRGLGIATVVEYKPGVVIGRVDGSPVTHYADTIESAISLVHGQLEEQGTLRPIDTIIRPDGM